MTMAPQPLNEANFVDKFIHAVFNSIANAKSARIRAAAAKDPEFQKIVKDLEISRANLAKWIERKRKEDPDFRERDDAIQNFYDIAARHG